MMKKLMSFALAFTFVFVGANAADAYSGIPMWEGDTSATSAGTSGDCTTCHYEGGKHVAPADLSWHPVQGTVSSTSCIDAGCHSTDTKTAVNSAINDAASHGGSTNCGSCHGGTLNVTFNDATDADADGLNASYEASLGTDDTKADTDGDGKTDFEEINGYTSGSATVYSNPTAVESDHDAIYDAYEVANGMNPGQPGDKTNGGAGTGTTYDVEVVTGEAITATDAIVWDAAACEPDDTIRPSVGTVSFDPATGLLTYTASKTSNGVTTPAPVGTDKFEYQWVDANGDIQRATVNVTITAPPVVDNDNDGLTSDVDPDDNNVDTDGDGIYDGFDDNPTTPDVTEPVDPGYGIEEEFDTDGDGIVDSEDEYPNDPTNGFTDLTPSTPDEDLDEDSDEENNNPETGGTAGLMLSVGITAVAGAGLVVSRKRK